MVSVKSNIWKMNVFRFLLSLQFVAGVLVPFFLEWGRITFFQIMLLQSWFMLWLMLLEIPTGAIADRFGRKPTLVIGALLNAAGVLVYTVTPDFYMFMLAEFLWAFALAMMSGADESMVYDSLKVMKQERLSKKVLGRFGSMEVMGIAIGAPIGSLIAAAWGIRWAMLLMSIPFMLAFLVGFTLKEPAIRIARKKASYLQTLKSGVSYFYSHKILRILAFDSVAIGVLVFLDLWLFQPKLQQLGVGIAYFGLVSSAMAVMQLAILNNFVRIERFVGSKKRYMLLSAVIPGLGFALLGITNNAILSIILIVLIGGFGIPRYILFSNYMNKYIESHNRSTVLSTISMFRSLGMAVSYPLVGLLAEMSLNGTLIIVGILILTVSLISRVEEEHLID